MTLIKSYEANGLTVTMHRDKQGQYIVSNTMHTFTYIDFIRASNVFDMIVVGN